ncbi:MAG: hypothetical protein ACYTGP_07110 [Planctomycetota bacterium]|jgi:hypothetical protein
MKTHARTACRARSPRRLARTIIPLALLLVAATPALAQRGHRGHGHQGHDRPRYVEPCEAPTWQEIEYDRGAALGNKEGYRNGMSAGRYREVFCDAPTRRLKRASRPFARGYRKAYAKAYSNGYRRGEKFACGNRRPYRRHRPFRRFRLSWPW